MGSSVVKKGTTLLGNVDDGGGCACVKAEGVCKSLHLLNFAVNIKLLLKDEVFNRKKNELLEECILDIYS